MKRILLAIIMIFSLTFVPLCMQSVKAEQAINSTFCNDPALKETTYCNADGQATQTNTGSNTGVVGKVLRVAINLLSWGGGIAAVIVMLVSAIRITTSGGNSQSISSARNAIIYSFVGLVVIILARIIIMVSFPAPSAPTTDPNACSVGGQGCKS